ncbi:type II toxin-antitoxin system VapC family toxin [Marinivivus vitaminiproducens]|uniref:type II toxin-antitoxin system VapC family toxin n=1 Tax=Marinivivus vitaminiproducens TaxID=3035935 RepID=UPI0027A1F96E|nr:type II toxin-antitoxin system VapC family toxin [Geminicoccaceae bacterium SCSIO 64248]
MKRLLLDTNILLWSVAFLDRLDDQTINVLEAADTQVFFSAASIWEIAIKASLGRGDFDVEPEAIAEEARNAGFVELPIRSEAASLVGRLPLHHKDPFDRILIAQAMATTIKLYTTDALLARYSELVTVVPRA